ncbi:unnamed protein product [Vitrella brassicaformis CCMP3155]|uniref:Solute-binding protein family 3/N-terminal domain-containing protein n=1 Tax=Vitrella brassicaformis (strain CCMP3155) TaxID=1169540 RepID=A0A0G4FS45_VITBC|nr:unnamed protein product [Vitrella brassicaformis CCMP3155]|eukprot:CEM17510.1 unnamed protein product [Vitrella brassicaformis CCMP3155]
MFLRSLISAFCFILLTSPLHAHHHDGASAAQLTSRSLVSAFDAALMDTLDNDPSLITKGENSTRIAAWTCNPRGDWSYPPMEDLSEEERLFWVLKNRTLRVGALGPYDWGPDGNYTKVPPEGFWPDYLAEIVSRLGAFYGMEVQIERVFFADSKELLETLDDGESAPPEKRIDMTEPYYILSALDHTDRPRQERFLTSCTTLGTIASVLVKEDSPLFNRTELSVAMKSRGSWTVGVLSAGNFDGVRPVLPRNATQQTYSNDADLVAGVINSEVIAAIHTGKVEPELMEGLREFTTGFVQSQAAFFRLDRPEEFCMAHYSEFDPRSASAAHPLVSVGLWPLVISMAGMLSLARC